MISKLHIINFRNLHDITFDSFGLVNRITGSNGAGKTTIIESILWVLSDETIIFKKNNDKNINRYNRNEILEVEVEFNGRMFKRKYGYFKNEDDVLTAINSFYVNDRRLKTKSEYLNYIYESAHISLDTLSKLTKCKVNPVKFFVCPTETLEGIEEKDLRKLLESILNVDIVSEILKDSQYTALKADFASNMNDIENLNSFYNQKIKKLDTEIVSLNALHKNFIDSYDSTIEEQKGKLEDEIKSIEKETFTDNEEISKIKTQIEELKNKHEDLIYKNDEYLKLTDKINITKADVEHAQRNLEVLTKSVEDNKGQLDTLIANRDRLENLKSYYENNINNFKNAEIKEDKCPNCGFVLNKDKLDKIKEKNQSALDKINLDYEKYKEDYQKILFQIKDKKTFIQTKNQEVKQSEESLTKLRENLKSLYEKQHQLAHNESIIETERQVNDLYTKLNELISGNDINRNKFNEDKLRRINSLRMKLYEINHLLEQKTNDDILLEKRKGLIDEKQLCEYKASLLTKFVKDEILAINKYLSYIFGESIEFVMIEDTKSNANSYKKVCYPKYKGKDYDSWNTASRLELAIMIIDKMKKYLGGIDLPIIFDIGDNLGASILNRIISSTDSQMFFTTIQVDDCKPLQLVVEKE